MRYLGIDHGEKRMGIAISDPEGRIAFPKRVIFNRGNTRMMEQIRSLLQEEGISEVVVGLPISMDGGETDETRNVRRFAEELKKNTVLPIHFENEVLTTRLVEQFGVKKEHTDEAAAALILQSYLDKQNKI